MKKPIEPSTQSLTKVVIDVHYYETEVENIMRLSDGIRMFKSYHPDAFDIKGNFTQKEDGKIILTITYKE